MTDTTVHPSLAASDTLEALVSKTLGTANLPRFDYSNIITNAAQVIALQAKCIETAGTEAYKYYDAALKLAIQRLLREGHMTVIANQAYEHEWSLRKN